MKPGTLTYLLAFTLRQMETQKTSASRTPEEICATSDHLKWDLLPPSEMLKSHSTSWRRRHNRQKLEMRSINHAGLMSTYEDKIGNCLSLNNIREYILLNRELTSELCFPSELNLYPP